MAMNKKETAAMVQAQADLADARRVLPALRWPTEPRPVPIDKEAAWKQKETDGTPYGQRHVTGWAAFCSSDGKSGALRVWSESIRHGYGHGPRPHPHCTASQGEGPKLYATRLEALIEARYQLAEKCARLLAAVDTKIEAERLTPTDFNAPISPVTGE